MEVVIPFAHEYSNCFISVWLAATIHKRLAQCDTAD